jgi:hypothetical protein
MLSWPPLGTRVTVRYRRPPGSVPPLSDAVGHLLAVDPVVRVRTKNGAVVELAPADAVALRVLTDTPVRTSDIRALEHAAASACPGAEHAWLNGWLLRTGNGPAANSAVPLEMSAGFGTVPAISAWYERRGLTPWLAVPDRLLQVPRGMAAERTERVLVREVGSRGAPDPSVTLSPRPGEVVVGAHPGGAEARAWVTDAPDGTRWVGLSTVAVDTPAALWEALLAWGGERGATRAYAVVPETGPLPPGFHLHHRRRYFRADSSAWDTV